MKWPSSQQHAPDYRCLSNEPDYQVFRLTHDVLDRLIALNRHAPYAEKGLLAFALRGAQLVTGHEIERTDSGAR